MSDEMADYLSELERDMQLLRTQIENAKKAANWNKANELEEVYHELTRKKEEIEWTAYNIKYLETYPKKNCLCPKCTRVIFEGNPKFCPRDGTTLIAYENKCSFYCGGKLSFMDTNCPKCGKQARWKWEGWKYPY
jgi:hypothetical protein